MSSLSLAQQSAAFFVNISTGVVGVNTLSACNVSISGTTVGGGGIGGVGILANVGWTPTTNPAFTLTPPAGGVFTTSSSNAQHRWIGNDLGYTFNITGTVTAAATNPAQDYTITVPYPVAIAASYPTNTIVGDLWLSVVYGGNTNLFKAYARTLTTDANRLVVRAITGSTDESLGTLLAGSVITLQGTATYATTSVNQNTGGALASGLQTVWIPSTAVNWAPTPTSPSLTLPAGAALTYSRSNARYMYVGTDITYNVDIGGTLTASPTNAANDYQLSVPYPVATSTYTNPTIVGELWLSVVNGLNSNTFKSYARTLTGASSNTVTLRMLTGTADESLGALTSGSTFTLQGTLKYTTTLANSNIGVPTSYIAAEFKQNAYGDVGLNTGTSNIRAKFDIIHNSNTPALIVDQYGAGDALQVRDGGVTKFVVDAAGNVGIGTGTPQIKLDVLDNIRVGKGNRNHIIINEFNASESTRWWLLCSIPRQTEKYLHITGNSGRVDYLGAIKFILSARSAVYNPRQFIYSELYQDDITQQCHIKVYLNTVTDTLDVFIYAFSYTYQCFDCKYSLPNFNSTPNWTTTAPTTSATYTLIYDTSVNSQRVTNVSTGYVGIGTTNPLAKLHVNGDIISSTTYIARWELANFTGSYGTFNGGILRLISTTPSYSIGFSSANIGSHTSYGNHVFIAPFEGIYLFHLCFKLTIAYDLINPVYISTSTTSTGTYGTPIYYTIVGTNNISIPIYMQKNNAAAFIIYNGSDSNNNTTVTGRFLTVSLLQKIGA